MSEVKLLTREEVALIIRRGTNLDSMVVRAAATIDTLAKALLALFIEEMQGFPAATDAEKKAEDVLCRIGYLEE